MKTHIPVCGNRQRLTRQITNGSAVIVRIINFDDALSGECLSCASEVARRMGATEKEAQMVAGFAGGIGLSGKACGALGAAIWMKNINMLKENKAMSYSSSPEGTAIIERFYQETDFEIRCEKISGRVFKDTEDHTEYIKNGGCGKLLEVLAGSN